MTNLTKTFKTKAKIGDKVVLNKKLGTSLDAFIINRVKDIGEIITVGYNKCTIKLNNKTVNKSRSAFSIINRNDIKDI